MPSSSIGSSLEQKEVMTIKLRTVLVDVHSAEAKAVSATMDAAVAVLQEIVQQLKLPFQIRIKVRSFEPGSLEIPLELHEIGSNGIAYLAYGLLATEVVLRFFKLVFYLKKRLKGNDPPDSAKDGVIAVNSTTIHVNQIVINTYKDPDVNKALSRAATELQKDDGVGAVEFIKGEGEERETLEVLEKSDLAYLTNPDKSLDVTPASNERQTKVELVIVKPVLNGSDDKWNLKFRGDTIWATIEDEGFRRSVVERKEQFGAGDRLLVTLKIHQEWNPALTVFENKGYTIVKVHSHTPPPRQTEFAFNDDRKPAKKRAKPSKKKAAKKSTKKSAKKNGGKKKGK